MAVGSRGPEAMETTIEMTCSSVTLRSHVTVTGTGIDGDRRNATIRDEEIEIEI